MSTRRAKQLIYGTLYALILVVFCGVVYLFFIRPFTSAPVARCTPSSCAPTSTAVLVPGPSLLQTFVTVPGQYTFLAQVTDASADYGAPSFQYAIELEDASGMVLQSIPASSFIYPAQTKYLAVLNQAVAQPFDHAVLAITGASWASSSTMGAIPAEAPGQFAVQNVQSAVASATVSVGGQLVNANVASYAQVIVMVIFNGTFGGPVGVSQTELDGVAAGTTENFSVIYPNESNVNPAVNQIFVYALR